MISDQSLLLSTTVLNDKLLDIVLVLIALILQVKEGSVSL